MPQANALDLACHLPLRKSKIVQDCYQQYSFFSTVGNVSTKTKVSCFTHEETNEQRGQGASLMLRSTSKGHEGDPGVNSQAAVSPGEVSEGALGTQPHTAPGLTRRLTGKVTATRF